MMNDNTYRNPYVVVANAGEAERGRFVRQTYVHLAGAIAAFVAIAALLLNSPLAPAMMGALAASKYGWLIVLGLFMLASWIAQRWAQSDTSRVMQYVGLGLYVAVQAVIFVPLLYVAAFYSSPDVIPMAAMITAGLFLGLTAVVVTTRADFSFLRGVLVVGSFVALGIIAASILFGFDLGLLFSGAMVLLAGASILYNTSSIYRDYRTDQYVAASLALFASVALLFWYVLRIMMGMRRD